MAGELLAIFLCPAATAEPHRVESARVFAGRGIEGDRYTEGRGTFSANAGRRDITLIEEEALEQFAWDYGCKLEASLSRRNLLTRGVRLNDLVGQEFFVGAVAMRGLRLCEPCAHLARLTGLPVLPGLIRRGGLYAEILQDGEVREGDVIGVGKKRCLKAWPSSPRFFAGGQKPRLEKFSDLELAFRNRSCPGARSLSLYRIDPARGETVCRGR